MVHVTFASKLAATQSGIFFIKKISQHIRIICRFVYILHHVFLSPSFIIFVFYSHSWPGKNAPELIH